MASVVLVTAPSEASADTPEPTTSVTQAPASAPQVASTSATLLAPPGPGVIRPMAGANAWLAGADTIALTPGGTSVSLQPTLPPPAAPTPVPRFAAELSAEPILASIKWSGSLQDSAAIEELRRSLANLRDDLLEPPDHSHQLMTSSIALSTGMSVGYVIWLVRGGALVGSMLSSMPLWNMVDPLPVLSRSGAGRGRGEHSQGDDASLENLFDTQGPSPLQAPPLTPAPPPHPLHALPPSGSGAASSTLSAPDMKGHP